MLVRIVLGISVPKPFKLLIVTCVYVGVTRCEVPVVCGLKQCEHLSESLSFSFVSEVRKKRVEGVLSYWVDSWDLRASAEIRLVMCFPRAETR